MYRPDPVTWPRGEPDSKRNEEQEQEAADYGTDDDGEHFVIPLGGPHGARLIRVQHDRVGLFA